MWEDTTHKEVKWLRTVERWMLVDAKVSRWKKTEVFFLYVSQYTLEYYEVIFLCRMLFRDIY